jgi:anti-sigma factor RsiW
MDITDDDLLAYLDEQLPVPRASAVERELRGSASLRQRAALLIRRRDQGGHTLGEIWRRNRLSCPSRSQLGAYLLDTLDRPERDYLEFHLRTIGCRACTANLEDLRSAAATPDETIQRRRKYFESSAGNLNVRSR